MPRASARLDAVLPLLLASFIASAPVSVTREVSDLHFIAALEGGASVVDVDPDLATRRQRGPVIGARVGLRASRPPFVLGGGRLGLLPVVVVRHEPLAQRTECIGSVSVTTSVWRLMLLTGVGYGLSFLDGVPRHVLDVSAGIATKLGPVWVSLGLDSLMRLSNGGRALHVYATVGWELDLPVE